MFSVLYRRCRKQYHGNDWPLMILQGSFSLFVIVGACYLCYLLQPGQEMLFPYESGRPAKKRSYIEKFGSLSQALEGVLIAVPA
jgi:hypothetical protein